MSDLTLVQGNTGPPLKSTLRKKLDDGTSVIWNLTLDGVDFIKFQMRPVDGKRYNANSNATILDGTIGKVSYVFGVNELDTPGEYIAQWEIHFLDGKVQTTDPANTITIRRS